jgi:NAD(P)-dependent dehydrogenase (short-subunit alcohol dehydrogenase family)
MVTLTEVHSSNALIPTTFPTGLTAIFIGGTNGIGLYTLRAFTKHTLKPTIIFTGRSQEAGDRITTELRTLNPSGTYTFIKADTSLLKNVDEVANTIKSQIKTLNLLFLTTGSLIFDKETPEGLNYAISLFLHSRLRFIQHFLPLLLSTPLPSLRRVVSVFTGTKEGTIILTPSGTPDFKGSNISFSAARGHGASLVTLTLERLASENPTVSFIHDFPGPVRSGIARGTKGFVMGAMKVAFAVLGPLVYIPEEECGERHVYLATNERYAPRDYKGALGVQTGEGVQTARGIYGAKGGGMYSIDEKGEGAGEAAEKLVAGYMGSGMREMVWEEVEADFVRITGSKEPKL